MILRQNCFFEVWIGSEKAFSHCSLLPGYSIAAVLSTQGWKRTLRSYPDIPAPDVIWCRHARIDPAREKRQIALGSYKPVLLQLKGNVKGVYPYDGLTAAEEYFATLLYAMPKLAETYDLLP